MLCLDTVKMRELLYLLSFIDRINSKRALTSRLRSRRTWLG